MEKIKILLLISSFLFISGCSNFSPINRQRLNNQGEIEDIKSNQNGVMAEIGKLKQDAQILDSQLKDIQNGLVNINSMLSRNDNNGIQILQGDGALILVFSLATIGMILFYRQKAIENEKNVSILAKEITKINDASLNDKILQEALKEGTAKSMLKTLKKNLQEPLS